MPDTPIPDPRAQLAARVAASGRTLADFARHEMGGRSRVTLWRWLTGRAPIPAGVRAWLASHPDATP